MKKMNSKELKANHRKLQRIKEEKEFVDSFKDIIVSFGDQNALNLLPEQVIQSFYRNRILAFKLDTQHVPELDAKTIKNLQNIISFLCKKEDKNQYFQGQNYNLEQLVTVGLSLVRLLNFCKENIDKEDWMSDFVSSFSDSFIESLSKSINKSKDEVQKNIKEIIER